MAAIAVAAAAATASLTARPSAVSATPLASVLASVRGRDMSSLAGGARGAVRCDSGGAGAQELGVSKCMVWLPFFRGLALPAACLAAALTQLDHLLGIAGGKGLLPKGARLATSFGVLIAVLDRLREAIVEAPTPDRAVTVEQGSCVLKSAPAAADVQVTWTSASMRGWRPAMEDEHAALSAPDARGQDLGVFAVFDGHGGAGVSHIARHLLAWELPKRLASYGAADAGAAVDASPSAASIGDGAPEGPPDVRVGGGIPACGELGRVLHEAVLDIDTAILRGPLGMGSLMHREWLHPFSRMGSTSCIAVLDPARSRIVVANTGDSRAVLCVNGEARALSDDHKPENRPELLRIVRAGGQVRRSGPCFRIDNGLNLSRALGDFCYKAHPKLPADEQRVIAVPDIESYPWDARRPSSADDFLIVACDGLFERMSRQELVSFVRCGLQSGRSPEVVMQALLQACCAPDAWQAGQDNETAILVQWRPAG